MNFRPSIAQTLVVALLLTAVASAQQPAATQNLQYKISTGAQGAKATSDVTLNIAVTATDADGTRHGKVIIDVPHAPKMDPIDVTVSPAGALLIKQPDKAPSFHMFMSKADQSAAAASGYVVMANMSLSPFNQLAAACAQQKSFQPGASWHSSAGATMMAADLAYTVKGMEQRGGRNTVHVTFQNVSSSAPMQITGEGFYDPAAHLVVSTHFVQSQPGSTQGEMVDIGLVNG